MTDSGDLVDISELSSEHGRLAVHYDIGTWISCPPAFPAGFDRQGPCAAWPTPTTRTRSLRPR